VLGDKRILGNEQLQNVSPCNENKMPDEDQMNREMDHHNNEHSRHPDRLVEEEKGLVPVVQDVYGDNHLQPGGPNGVDNQGRDHDDDAKS